MDGWVLKSMERSDWGLLESVLEQGTEPSHSSGRYGDETSVWEAASAWRIGGSIVGFATAMRMDANLESGQEVVDANPTDRPRRT